MSRFYTGTGALPKEIIVTGWIEYNGAVMPLLTLDPTPLLYDFRVGPKAPASPLRIAICGGPFIHRWEKELCEWLAGLSGFHVQNLRCGAEEPALRGPRAREKPGWLFERLYSRSRTAFDPFVNVELPRALPWELGQISANPWDVAIWLPSLPLPEGPCAALARFGVLSFRLGLGNRFPPYCDESYRQETVSPVEICWHAETFRRARVVASAELSTFQGILFTHNSRRPLAAAAHLVASVCLEMFCKGAAWVSEVSRIPEKERIHVPAPFPTTLQTARFLAARIASPRRRAEKRRRPEAWFIVLRRDPARNYAQSGRFVPEGLEPVPLTRGWDMADPFLLEDRGRTWLFFEEVLEWQGKGRLACLEILDDGKFTPPEVVLEKDYHLSFPCVFRHDGEIFMIPESHAAGRVDLYRATRFPGEFRLEKTCLKGLDALDTVPLLWENRWYFFTTIPSPLQTLLFWSDRLDGEWRLHSKSPISRSVRGGRAAGAIMQANGRLLRPVQDCSVRYGYAIMVNEISKLTPDEFAEEPVDVILPSWRPGLLGTHTLNHSDRFEVLDGVRFHSVRRGKWGGPAHLL